MNTIKKISNTFLPVFISVITINAASAQGRPNNVIERTREQRDNRTQAAPSPSAQRQPNTVFSNTRTYQHVASQNANRPQPEPSTSVQRPPNTVFSNTRTYQHVANNASQNTNRPPVVYSNGYGSNYHSGYRNSYARPYRYYYTGAYHYYPSYYRPFSAPSFGLRINVLPSGYYRFNYNHSRYYYCGGNFYRPYGGYYETILPPLGAYVPILPTGAYPVYINDLNYYEYGGTYYQPYSGGYQVAGVNGYLRSDLPPANDGADIISDDSLPGANQPGAPLTVLPGDFKTVTLNNIVYYVSPAGEYYTKNIDEKGNVTYRVAAVESPGK